MLEFWFDFASGYSYIAAMQIEAMCSAVDVKLVWKPFLLGPIFALQGWNDSHFNLNPRRGAYMWRDLERLCGKFGQPFRRPAVFPRNSTLAARVASSIVDEPWAGEFIRRVLWPILVRISTSLKRVLSLVFSTTWGGIPNRSSLWHSVSVAGGCAPIQNERLNLESSERPIAL